MLMYGYKFHNPGSKHVTKTYSCSKHLEPTLKNDPLFSFQFSKTVKILRYHGYTGLNYENIEL